MARLMPNKKRTEGTLKQNLGKVIVFCEGYTEFNYFNYFKKYYERNRSRYTDIILELPIAGGNARAVLNCAENFFSDEGNSKKYQNYERYLIFDCDSPPKIDEVIIETLESKNEYKLLVTNLIFELWLLMHFENVTIDQQYKKVEIEKKIEMYLDIPKVKKYETFKNNEGIIRKIIENADRVRDAIKNAKELGENYKDNYNIKNDICKMNPYTNVHEFVERIIESL